MNNVVDWLTIHYEFLFSGIGVAALGWLATLFFSRRKRRGDVIQTAKNSSNITQVGGDIRIGLGDD